LEEREKKEESNENRPLKETKSIKGKKKSGILKILLRREESPTEPGGKTKRGWTQGNRARKKI